MGTTRFLGPVYGAKTLLFVAHRATVATTQTDLEIFQVDVPADEDWYVCNIAAYCSNQGTAGTVDVEDDGTSVMTASITLTSAGCIEGTITSDAHEDEGKRVAAASVVTVDATNGATTAIADLSVSVWGYIRKLPVSN